MKSEVISNSEEETAQVARKVAQLLPRPAVVLLEGDLGAGKTVFSRNLAQALGVEGTVSSPTFNIVQEYDINNGSLYHMDLYRLSGDDEAIAFGIDDYLSQKTAVCLIEWPSRLEWLLDGVETYKVELQHVSEFQRKIIVSENLRDLN
ncbi:MAG: tRNA (adenosine(37)-N6)-threonylcarbamoyltransferase complex ATPase subunit type 1 TsaE [Lentisphaeraceae bacterium]|nr:tRNA (adenosine(37)-N6)-threonylcarbamoyltransferase complex ATPase subunit type 1 TsaE [Lentisphaeraceae bacterium]